VTDWKKLAEDAWANPNWAEAAKDYRREAQSSNGGKAAAEKKKQAEPPSSVESKVAELAVLSRLESDVSARTKRRNLA
jgi:hypothetical protein